MSFWSDPLGSIASTVKNVGGDISTAFSDIGKGNIGGAFQSLGGALGQSTLSMLGLPKNIQTMGGEGALALGGADLLGLLPGVGTVAPAASGGAPLMLPSETSGLTGGGITLPGTTGVGGAGMPSALTDTSLLPSDVSGMLPADSSLPGVVSPGVAGVSTPGTAGSWISGHIPQLGLVGLSAYEAGHQPKLPGAAQTQLGPATANLQQAQQILASGGTGTPMWQTQKSSIDAAINQQMQQEQEALLQAAANSGMGANSAVTQQNINNMKQRLETQRQQLYLQAQQQNIATAISEMSGGNQVLTGIANTQFQQSQQAQQAAAQTAQLIFQLMAMSGGG